MSVPKFKIGEEIIRQAPNTNYPEHNGIYIIEDIITTAQYNNMYGNHIIASGNYYYKLSGLNILFESKIVVNHSSERFLRKKYPPSTESFHEMMAKLKSKEKA